MWSFWTQRIQLGDPLSTTISKWITTSNRGKKLPSKWNLKFLRAKTPALATMTANQNRPNFKWWFRMGPTKRLQTSSNKNSSPNNRTIDPSPTRRARRRSARNSPKMRSRRTASTDVPPATQSWASSAKEAVPSSGAARIMRLGSKLQRNSFQGINWIWCPPETKSKWIVHSSTQRASSKKHGPTNPAPNTCVGCSILLKTLRMFG